MRPSMVGEGRLMAAIETIDRILIANRTSYSHRNYFVFLFKSAIDIHGRISNKRFMVAIPQLIFHRQYYLIIVHR